MNEDTGATHKKRNRHRKKQMSASILKQMEFYFSDAALSKDRFLSQLIAGDPFVPLATFLTFNKIKSLTDKTQDIAKALAASTTLELSEDGTKVKRINELSSYDPDPRTIYVENIPLTTDVKKLTDIFQAHGPVAYVSLPKFHGTNRIKGFAFVEFESSNDADKCLKAFTAMGCKLPTSVKPEELSSCQGLLQELDSNPKKGENDDDKATIEIIKTENSDTEKTDNEKDQNGTETHEPPAKRVKTEQLDDSGNDSKVEDKMIKPKITITDLSEDGIELETSELVEDDENNEKANKSKKKRDRKKIKDKEKKNLNAVKGLQVLSKKEWKVLRNKYLNLQRKHMEVLKRALRTQHTVPEHRGKLFQNPFPYSDNLTEETEIVPKEKPPAEIPFVEGVIVSVQLAEPCLDVKQLKQSTKANIHVKYVDVKEGSTEVRIRMDDGESAKQFAASGVFPQMRVLEGDEEKLYWEEIKKQQSGRSSIKRKMRGRDRLIKKAQQVVNTAAPPVAQAGRHIRFDE